MTDRQYGLESQAARMEERQRIVSMLLDESHHYELRGNIDAARALLVFGRKLNDENRKTA